MRLRASLKLSLRLRRWVKGGPKVVQCEPHVGHFLSLPTQTGFSQIGQRTHSLASVRALNLFLALWANVLSFQSIFATKLKDSMMMNVYKRLVCVDGVA